MKIISIPKEKRRICRHILLFLLLGMLFLPTAAQPRGSGISISAHNVTVKEAFDQITAATGYKFMYDEQSLRHAPRVTLRHEQADLPTILDDLSRQTKLTYTQKESTILVGKPSQEAEAQKPASFTVSGNVADENGEAVIGATVLLKGTSHGTITDIDGHYSLDQVKRGDIITITYVGYESQHINIKDNKPYNVTLYPSEHNLDEVVVVGYGVQRKRDLTTAISSLKASELDVPVSSIDQALTGKMAGVQVTQPSGIPGGGMSIKVRGTGTISAGTEPLYVVDGFPMSDGASAGTGMTVNPLSSINMNDIESIEVLKDASAAAIYGSRGANGVVIITTKRGREGKPVVQYDGYYGVQQATKKIKMMNAYQQAEINAEARNNTYLQLLADAGVEGSIYDTNDERRAKLGAAANDTRLNYIIPDHLRPYLEGVPRLTDTDWQDEVLRNANVHSHNVSVTGGTKEAQYFLSANYRNEEGIVIGSGFEQMGGRAKVDVKHNKLGFGANVSFNHSNYDLVPTEDRYTEETILSTALGMLPSFPVYNADGGYDYSQVILNHGIPNLINPVALANLRKDNMKRNRILGNLYAEHEIIRDLKLRTSFGIDFNSFRRNIYRPSTLPTLSNTAVLTASNPEGTTRTKDILDWVWESTLSYYKVFDDVHTLSAVTGWTMQKESIDGSRITATGFPNDLVETLNAAPLTGISAFDSTRQQWSLMSWLARAQYNYKNKYLLSAAIRMDGSSRFGTDNRWGTFPSVSGGWYISEEDFLADQRHWLSALKLRASWGLSGNFSIGNYEYYSTLSNDDYVFGTTETLVSGLRPANAGNPELGWEKTSMVDVGLEVGLFNMLTLEVDVYNSLTSDMLLSVPVPETSGYSEVLKNVGKLRNRGLEISLSTSNRWGDFGWKNSLNFSMNRNVVLDLGGVDQMITKGETMEFITKVGEPIGNYYCYITDGVFMNEEEIRIAAEKDPATGIAYVPGAQAGDFKYVDQNHDGEITSEDKTIAGNYMPDFTYGYSTELTWRWLDLSIALQGVYGNEIANINRRYLNNMEGGSGQIDALNRWRSEENPGNGLVPRANRSSTGLNSQMSTWHIEDGSYLRIRNITLGVTLPQKWVNTIKIQNARVYVSAQNPFTFTRYSGYNPEVNKEDNPLTPGIDYGTYPLAKSFVIGLNVTF